MSHHLCFGAGPGAELRHPGALAANTCTSYGYGAQCCSHGPFVWAQVVVRAPHHCAILLAASTVILCLHMAEFPACSCPGVCRVAISAPNHTAHQMATNGSPSGAGASVQAIALGVPGPTRRVPAQRRFGPTALLLRGFIPLGAVLGIPLILHMHI